MKCPVCNTRIETITSGYECNKCGFFMTTQKFEHVVHSLYKFKKVDIDNLAELNNLNHKKVSDDFSDSPTERT